MPGRRPTLLLYLVALAAAAAILVPILRSERAARERAAAVPSSYLSGPRGYLALYLLLERSGVPARRFRGPFGGLPEDGGRRLLIVAGPSRRPVAGEEAARLRAWISRGNTLLWLAGAAPGREEELRRTLEACPGSEWKPPEDEGLDLPVSEVTAYGDGVDLLSAPPRHASTGPLPLPVPGGAGTAERGKPAGTPLPPSWVALAGTVGEGTVAAKRRIGEGSVLYLPTTLFLDNEGISRSGNLDFFLGILELHRPAEVLLDEYHHGYEAHPLAPLARDPRARAALWQLLALVGLYLAARLGRLGPPRPALRDERRPSADYVRALGNLFRKGRKAAEVARSLRRAFRSRLERRAGLPQRLEDRELARLLEERSGVRAARLGPALEAAREGRVKGERELLELARALRRAEEEVESWRKR